MGTIVSGPLQLLTPLDRLHAMNAALAGYSTTARKRSPNPDHFAPLVPMPGNAADSNDTSACFK